MIYPSRFLIGCGLLGATVFLGSCKSTSTGPASSNSGPAASPLQKAGAGSSYTFYVAQLNADGSLASSDSTFHTITRTGLTVDGKSDAFEVRQTAKSGMSMLGDMKYESNGDLSIYYPVGAYGWPEPSVWVTFPFASGTTVDQHMDTTEVIAPGFSNTYDLHFVITKTGNESITVLGKSYVAERVHFVMTATEVLAGGISTSASAAVDYWFVPDIGYFAKTDVPAYSTNSGYHGEQQQTLTQMTLK